MAVNKAIAQSAEKPIAQALSDDPSAYLLNQPLDPHYLFYRYACADGDDEDYAIPCAFAPPYSWTVWRPRRWPALPRGVRSRLRLRFLFRWGVHRMHLFAGSECGALLAYEQARLVHYSAFSPRYWRFPFVADNDLQIGDTWTDPAYRRRGLAFFALRKIIATLANPGRSFWYVVEADNEPSIRAAEKAGFTLAAEGTLMTPWGLRLAGAYVICRKTLSAGSGA
jgi:RimJ/RimL family protein N-acetyltransferase